MPNLDRPTDEVTSKPLVIVVGSGMRLYREYLLKSIAEHARVFLLTGWRPTWEQPYIEGYAKVDLRDVEQLVAEASAVAGREKVSGVVGWDEVRMVATTELACALGVPATSPESVRRCRDKHETRLALQAAGVGQPRSAVAETLEQASRYAEDFGYPVVIKPRRLAASIGVSTADSPATLQRAFEDALHAIGEGVADRGKGVLVEECVTGEEISVDCALVDGRLWPMFVARKMLGFDPYCEEVGHLVDARDPLLTDPELIWMLRAAHDAIGYRHGITHTEVMLTAAGPKIIEINARLGGDLIPLAASIATGLDIGAVVTAVSIGQLPVLPEYPAELARVDFVYPEFDMRVAEVTIPTGELPPGVQRVAALAAPGQVLRLPPRGHVFSRYGYLITHGQTAAECERAAAAGRQLFTITAAERLDDQPRALAMASESS